MNQNASPKFEILSLFEKGQSERLLKLDKLLLAALTLIYAVIALLNLARTAPRSPPGFGFQRRRQAS